VKERLRQLPVIGTAIRMQERYVDDAADALAASIGFFGFLSLFPLLALALSFVGFAISDDPAARRQVFDLITESVPALSSLAGGDTQIGSALSTIAERPGSFLTFGSIGLVLAGLRIASGAQQASAVVFRRERPTGLSARLEQIRALAVVSVFALAGAAVTGTVGVDISNGVEGVATSVLVTLLAVALDFALFMLAYRLFTPGPGPDWRTLVPGSVLAAVGWVALKLFGSAYATSQATRADSNFGALGSVIALLLLFYLAGRLYLYGAELAALLGHVDKVPSEQELVEDAVRVPQVSPRPVPDQPPEPSDAAKLAASSVALGIAASVLARVLRR
jgi:membrane protein